ncbi:MAG: hypothetical protein AVDCRST_MAG61-929, partial [uncultured Friedmanniella sp.]
EGNELDRRRSTVPCRSSRRARHGQRGVGGRHHRRHRHRGGAARCGHQRAGREGDPRLHPAGDPGVLTRPL